MVLEKDFASFDTAQRIEDVINGLAGLFFGDSSFDPSADSPHRSRAHAIDQVHIEVPIPEQYIENPIKFISFLLNTPIVISTRSSRVVINEREGVVVIGEDVEIAPVLVTHRSMRIHCSSVP